MLFVHQIYGQPSAEVDEIGNLGSTNANLFVSTLVGPSRRTPTAPPPTGALVPRLGAITSSRISGMRSGTCSAANMSSQTVAPPQGYSLAGNSCAAQPSVPGSSVRVTLWRSPTSSNPRCPAATLPSRARPPCERHVEQNLCLNGVPYDQNRILSGGCEDQSLQRHLHERSEVGRKRRQVAARHHQRTAVVSYAGGKHRIRGRPNSAPKRCLHGNRPRRAIRSGLPWRARASRPYRGIVLAPSQARPARHPPWATLPR